jgi:hypothetical protein
MGIMLPNELIWILDKIGLEWPDIDESEIWRGAGITRQFHSDMEALIQQVDRQISVDVAAGVQSKAGEAYVSAWNTQRSQNLQQFLDLLDPVSYGMNGAAGVVVALKVKFLAQIASELLQLIPLLAAGPLGAGLAVAKMVFIRFITGVAIDAAVNELIQAVDDPIINVMKEHLPAVMQMIASAPVVEDTGAEVSEIIIDLNVLDQAHSDMTQNAGDVESLVTQFMADIAGLKLTGD